ncbi:MAG: DUF362 domain-containing protein [Bacilli bacterium]|nr:DUF362 domain-containing protein [Bacilli bacterium]
MEKAKVYFIKEVTDDNIIRVYDALNTKLKGRVAVKVHSGEEGNQNYLRPEFLKKIIDYVDGSVVECNTAYEGMRNTTEKHWKLMEQHGWTKHYKVDIMDEEGQMELNIPNGKVIRKNYVGNHLQNYDSMLVISHFKGHPMGGYGGALKNISIGIASSYGKAYIHGAGEPEKIWTAEHDLFLESMADAAKSVKEYFKDNILFINIMVNMSVDCDCCKVAEDPCIKDIGILASTDPVALDKACIDLVYASNDPGKDHLIERIESRNGIHTIDAAYDLNVGNKDYELINLD